MTKTRPGGQSGQQKHHKGQGIAVLKPESQTVGPGCAWLRQLIQLGIQLLIKTGREFNFSQAIQFSFDLLNLLKLKTARETRPKMLGDLLPEILTQLPALILQETFFCVLTIHDSDGSAGRIIVLPGNCKHGRSMILPLSL